MPTKRRVPSAPPRSTTLRALRTTDLLDLHVTLVDARIESHAGERRLRTGAGGGVLVLTLPPQHAAEQAYLTSQAPAVPPVAALRVAESSRLAFDLPADADVPLSIDGLLELIQGLPLRTVPLATAAPETSVDITAPADLLPLRSGVLGRVLEAAQRTRRTRLATRALRFAPIDLPGLIDLPGPIDVGTIGRAGAPRRPGDHETAIEAPFRVVVSPSTGYGAFRHATSPVRAPSDPARTELWHTDLVASEPDQQVVRAVWGRDLNEHLPDLPFRTSLDRKQRRAIVRQSGARDEGVTPLPLEVRRLALTSLGAWIDWCGSWAETWNSYPTQAKGYATVESYTHQAAMGRDTYVRVTMPGFLFPFGHRAVWVTVTERKIDPDGEPVAYLWQRSFIVLRERTRTYPGRDTPLHRVTLSPTVTPDLDQPPGMPPNSNTPEAPFVPARKSTALLWDIDAEDAADGPVSLHAPLVFVPADALKPGKATDQQIIDLYADLGPIPADGAAVALAPSTAAGDTAVETLSLSFTGEIDRDGVRSRPFLHSARAVVPAMRHLSPASPPVDLAYTPAYLANGFASGNPAQLFVGLAAPADVSFSDGTDRSGGFIEPNLAVRGLSRSLGAVGDDGATPGGLGDGSFDPATFLDGALPRLFGLFSLVEILDAAGLSLENAPEFVTEAPDAVSTITSEAQRLQQALAHGTDRLTADLAAAAHDGARTQVQEALTRLQDAAAPVQAAVATLLDALGDLVDRPESASDVLTDAHAVATGLTGLLVAVDHPALPASVRAAVQRPARALQPLLAHGGLLKVLTDFADHLLTPSGSVTARYEWRPRITSWTIPGTDNPVFIAHDPRGLSLAVEVRVGSSGAPVADVGAELRSFALELIPGAPLLRMTFSRIGFRVSTGTKPEIDVVFDGLEFLGALGFIDRLREMIPFDGFADPPYVDVSTEGVTAGFDLALPNVSLGVFSLENISLGADARVPFLGDAVTVGFYFCRKDSPFRLTVMCIGGGGWVGLRASPKGLVELEMGLEAGASLSIDLGVASGSVSITVGVYLRLEGDAGSLTAYFRIRGEVDVLGLISACITLELSLTYDFGTGKLIGRASIMVEVEVLFFSASVEVSCERRLAGSKGDPTLADVMPPEPDGSSPAWSQYCAAFAGFAT